MELRFFLFQTVELAQCGMNVRALGQTHPIAQDRFQHREVTVPLGPEAGAGLRPGQAGDGADSVPDLSADNRVKEIEVRALRRSATLNVALMLPIAGDGDAKYKYLELCEGFRLGLDSG